MCLFSGFKSDYPYPHAHTIYFLERVDSSCKLRPEQFRAKLLMFAFGNALARAHNMYGVRIHTPRSTHCCTHVNMLYWQMLILIILYVSQPKRVLERPVTVQAVGTSGRIFQLVVFQLNTTDLSGDDGVKNQVLNLFVNFHECFRTVLTRQLESGVERCL